MNDVFGTAPTELTRSISLQRALQLIRVVVEAVEDEVPDLAGGSDEAQLREAVLRYSREVAFAAADVYARAAETRGSWDTRLEALVVDAILRGESSDALRSRIAAVGWKTTGPITVMVGGSPGEPGPSFVTELRRASSRYAADTLVGIQGDRLILVLGGVTDQDTAFVRLADLFGPGPVVYGPEARSLVDASSSAQAAFAGLSAAKAWPARAAAGGGQRPVARTGDVRRRYCPPGPLQVHLRSAGQRRQRAGGNALQLPVPGAFAGSHRARTVRPRQHRALPAAPGLRCDRLGPAAAAGGLRAPDRARRGPADRSGTEPEGPRALPAIACGNRSLPCRLPTKRSGELRVPKHRGNHLLFGKLEYVLAIVCPGQGSQTPGFLSPWLEVPGVAEHLGLLSDIAQLDLLSHGTVSDEETIKDTAVAQPLIVAAGLLAARALTVDEALDLSTVVAGHSVGEITASAVSGALTENDAMNFVRERANAMARAAAQTPTGMSAVLGGDPDEVLAAIEAAGLTPANANGGGQTVAAGTLEQLQAFAANPPAKARVIPLKVAGAFHTEHMAPAVAP